MKRWSIGGLPFAALVVIVFAMKDVGPPLAGAGPATLERALYRVMGAPAARVRTFNPAGLQANQRLLRVDRREMALAAADLAAVGDLSGPNVQRIDYVTSKCGVNVDVLDDIMDRRRITALFNYNQALFQKPDIVWGRIVQTGCQFEYQAKDWFHGFVVSLQPAVGSEGLDPNRLRDAQRLEFREGDVLNQIKRWNAPGAVRPPGEFRPGKVRPRPYSAAKHFRKRAGGYSLRFPEGGWMPAPTICGDRLFLSGGFDSSDYHAFDAKTGKNLWSVALSDNGPGSPVCKDGAVLFNTISCTLFALDQSTGRQRWSHFLGDILTSTPIVAGANVYTSYPSPLASSTKKGQGATGKGVANSGSSPTHVVIALGLRDGRIRWQRWIDSELIFAPVAAGDDVFATSMSGVVYRFGARDGSLRAARRLRATAPPLAAGGKLYFPRRVDRRSEGGHREALSVFAPDLRQGRAISPPRPAPHLNRKIQSRVKPGKGRAALRAERDSTAPPIAHAEAAWVQLGRRSLSGMMAYRGGRPVLHERLFFAVLGDRLLARRLSDGGEQWTIRLPGDLERAGEALATPPVIAGTDLFVGTRRGEILRIEPEDGRLIKRYAIGAPLREPPVIARGRIYAATIDGQLVMVDTGERSLSSIH